MTGFKVSNKRFLLFVKKEHKCYIIQVSEINKGL